jgi:hypothetical protein
VTRVLLVVSGGALIVSLATAALGADLSWWAYALDGFTAAVITGFAVVGADD